MTPQVNRIDREAITALSNEIVALAQGIRVTWMPAAQRLGCDRLVRELEATIAFDSEGSLRSLAGAVGQCLEGQQ